ncbi:MAG: beta-galactosidase [Clostridia bacterium]|nr:beta-galactosidase [Clostridia bacterium]
MLPEEFLYGGDYNPEQWLDYPHILERDIELMRKAHINTVTLGVFSWAALEPEENVFTFDWLERMVDRLHAGGISTIMATPSGARPRWLAEKYPEVLRVREDRTRELFGARHNHCYTSGAYRDRVQMINSRLAQTFADHPAVLMWHVSNEYSGECHCPLCQEAFRGWLKDRYDGDIDALNHAWWTAFWSHTYTDFSQIESPSSRGDSALHGLNLDWKRFVTAQTADFLRHEIEALRAGGARQPTTINLMDDYTGLDYGRLAKEVDIVSWDSYPRWHRGADAETALETGLQHDLMRGLKEAPFLLMESCPASPNWHEVSKAKRPGMLACAGLQAVAHGSDSVQFFQIRQSRGSSEKLHGAVIDHYGGEDTRVFREAAQLGSVLGTLEPLAHSRVEAPAAVLWDMESRWAMEDAQGPRNARLHYHETLVKVYGGLRRSALNVDVIPASSPLGSYEIVAAPMLYMLHPGTAERLRDFVSRGGTLIMTYWSGVADETDLCFLGPAPHDLTDVLGLRREEIDALYDGEENRLVPAADGGLAGGKSYVCRNLCEIVRLNGAKPLLEYAEDFYQGRPALTVNRYGLGRAYYLCADAEASLHKDLAERIMRQRNLRPILADVPDGCEVTSRTDGSREYVFVQNYSCAPAAVPVPPDAELLSGAGNVLPAYGTLVFARPLAGKPGRE